MDPPTTQPPHVTIAIAFASLSGVLFFGSANPLVLIFAGLGFILAVFGVCLLYWTMLARHMHSIRERLHTGGRFGWKGVKAVSLRWLDLWKRQAHEPTEEEQAELGYLNVLAAMVLVTIAVLLCAIDHIRAVF